MQNQKNVLQNSIQKIIQFKKIQFRKLFNLKNFKNIQFKIWFKMLKLAGFNSTIYSFNKKTGVSFTPKSTKPTDFMMHSSKSLAIICCIWAEQCFSDQFRTWITFPSQIYIDCMFLMKNILSKTVSCCASEREIIPWIILHLPQINLRTPFDAKTKTIPQHSWNPIFQTSWLCDYVSFHQSMHHHPNFWGK